MPEGRRMPPIEYSGKLVYPTTVSINPRTGRPDKRGTYGFISPTNQGHAFVKEWIKIHRQFKKEKNEGGQREAAEMIFRNLRSMAHQSDYFMRMTPPKIREIRERLRKAGIRVEEPIQDLKDGREVLALKICMF
jgi:hypothetical protein